jgi:hypothetical protein
METFRISKYNPRHRDLSGKFINNEWTSVSEINQVFDNCILTKEDYLVVENKYVNTVVEFTKYLHVNCLIIKDVVKLEMLFSDNYSSLYDNKLVDFYKSVIENQEITYPDFGHIIRLLLREDISGRLEDKDSRLSIDFGYDYYMFMHIDLKSEIALKKICIENGLFMEISEFPISYDYAE